ncbi:hypothetical protein, partial [Faecalibaculum rodentium]|uniref:hypothetical protein n=1 Tax=Faecalibaculum rodentium TaxID=1702221 RepID=UPI0032206F42
TKKQFWHSSELPLRLHHFRFDLIEQSKRPGSHYLWTFNLLFLPIIIQDFLCRSYRNQMIPDKWA